MHDLNVSSQPTVLLLCDDGAGLVPFLRHYVYADGSLDSVKDTTLDGSTTYATIGTGVSCGGSMTVEKQVLCDTLPAGAGVVKFIRYAVLNSVGGAVTSTFDTDLAGIVYNTVGAVDLCDDPSSTPQVLCDDQGSGTVVRFVRHFKASGDSADFFDTDLAGASYTPAGAVKSCEEIQGIAIPVVTNQNTDGTVSTTAGSSRVAVTNRSAVGTVTIAGTVLIAGMSWEGVAPNGSGLASFDIVVAGGGSAYITEITV